MEPKIRIEYDGQFPNLCSGKLIVYINEKKWEFPDHCLGTGGSVSFTKDWSEIITSGPWRIHDDDWPDKFPEEYKEAVLDEINCEISHGCCGGCV